MNSSIIIVICICATVLAIVAILVFGLGRKTPADTDAQSGGGDLSPRRRDTTLSGFDQQDSQISFEKIDSLTPAEEERMVEITNQELLVQIDSIIPVAAQVAVNASAINNAGNVIKSVGEVLKADVPLSMLDKSREVAGSMRGSVHAGGKYIKNANLTQVDMQRVTDNMNTSLVNAGTLNAAMGIASVVVGQYYMAQINDRMDSLEQGVDKVSDFQDAEFRGRIMNLIADVKTLSTFKLETLEDESLRMRALSKIDRLEEKCAECLGHTNTMLQGYASKKDISYDGYEKLVGEADEWYDYQQILLQIMSEIAELDYTLSLGSKSRENCYAKISIYTKQSKEARTSLREWHEHNFSMHEINEYVTKRRKKGFEDVIMGVPGLFNEDLHYHDIHPITRLRINHQRSDVALPQTTTEVDLYKQDVQLIKKNGKTYYFPPFETTR